MIFYFDTILRETFKFLVADYSWIFAESEADISAKNAPLVTHCILKVYILQLYFVFRNLELSAFQQDHYIWNFSMPPFPVHFNLA